ncbi:MAG TPA: hypothetical protein VG870_08585 [Chitinophagaceae bacterium]|nr:hypothetical protein [Chitinophagaceae bacterium]
MQELFDQLAQSLLRKDTLADCRLEDLEGLAKKYPYFSVVHLLHTLRARDMDPERFRDSAEASMLYCNNLPWLDFLLQQPATQTAQVLGTVQPAVLPAPTANHMPGEQEPPVSQPEPAITAAGEPPAEPVPVGVSASHPEHPDDPEVITSPQTLSLQNSAAPTNTEPSDFFGEAVAPVTRVPAGEPDAGQEEEPVAAEAGTGPLVAAGADLPGLDQLGQEGEPPGVLVLEPYHTVDYFASQGIRLSQEDKPTDRFGLQLKSFTEWLKTLKKLPGAAPEPEGGREQKVASLAEHSLEGRDIVTETMAEVWAKQGNKQKAIEIYQKLSLLNPAKSAYFASLIESLKET